MQEYVNETHFSFFALLFTHPANPMHYAHKAATDPVAGLCPSALVPRGSMSFRPGLCTQAQTLRTRGRTRNIRSFFCPFRFGVRAVPDGPKQAPSNPLQAHSVAKAVSFQGWFMRLLLQAGRGTVQTARVQTPEHPGCAWHYVYKAPALRRAFLWLSVSRIKGSCRGCMAKLWAKLYTLYGNTACLCKFLQYYVEEVQSTIFSRMVYFLVYFMAETNTSRPSWVRNGKIRRQRSLLPFAVCIQKKGLRAGAGRRAEATGCRQGAYAMKAQRDVSGYGKSRRSGRWQSPGGPDSGEADLCGKNICVLYADRSTYAALFPLERGTGRKGLRDKLQIIRVK